MTGKTQAARQPSIDDLLASIRQAIHERVEPDAPARSHSAKSAKPAAMPDIGVKTGAEAGRTKRTVVTSGREGFAGLLGGDVRLEEALARLNQSGWSRTADAPVAAQAAHAGIASPPAPAPRLRPTIGDWGEGGDGGDGGNGGDGPAAPAGGPRQGHEKVALQGDMKRGAAQPRDELGKGGQMPEDHGATSRPTDRFARTPTDTDTGTDTGNGAGKSDLLSSQAARAANTAFSRLNDATAPRSPRAERPLDEMTRDCLRPLLKAWLDEHLPGMVERLVREEIARVARRGS